MFKRVLISFLIGIGTAIPVLFLVVKNDDVSNEAKLVAISVHGLAWGIFSLWYVFFRTEWKRRVDRLGASFNAHDNARKQGPARNS